MKIGGGWGTVFGKRGFRKDVFEVEAWAFLNTNANDVTKRWSVRYRRVN